MKIINTRLHGFFDYASGGVLLLPWITKFNQSSSDTLLLAAIGAVTIFMTILTDYELGLIKLIPMRAHLLLDVCQALLLIATPWLFALYNYMLYWPLLLGIMEIGIIVLSSPVPYRVRDEDRNITNP